MSDFPMVLYYDESDFTIQFRKLRPFFLEFRRRICPLFQTKPHRQGAVMIKLRVNRVSLPEKKSPGGDRALPGMNHAQIISLIMLASASVLARFII